MSFTKILCPIDFSPGSEQAKRVAARLATAANSELVLVHSVYVPPIAFGVEYTFPLDVLQQLEEDAQARLEAAVAEVTALGVKHVSSKLLKGVPWHEIVQMLDAQAFDVVVMGTEGRTGFKRVLLGSVAEKVVRHAPCSVITVHPDDEAKPFNHVLCPIDFSESAEYAVELAAQLAAPGGAGITLLHVVEVPVAYSGGPRVPGFMEDLDKRSADLLQKWAKRLESKVTVPVATRIRIGTPGAQTLAVLDHDLTFDLVVMGSHGRTGIKRALLGSVAEKVVRHASCPVLVARKRA